MKTFDGDAIYALLPLATRMQDKDAGGTLRALIGVIAAQAQIVDDNLYQLYDDLFVETCSPWVIPYIGDLIGYRPIRPIPPSEGPSRADVADTIGLRRRKGTLVMLDQLARDVTGWPAVVVEFFERLAVSQYVRNHVRLQNACVDVHGWATATDVDTAFDLATRSADVRRIASGRGRYNIPNIGIFLWRLRAFGGATLGGAGGVRSLAESTAASVGPNRYTFDPFGGDVALVDPPQPLPEFRLPARANVPFPLRRFPLYSELEALRAGTLQADEAVYFGDPPVLAVYDGSGNAIGPLHLDVCDLSQWTAPSRPEIFAAVDPELGRMTFNTAVFAVPAPVRVSYAYAFSGEYGGGTYQRPLDPGEGAATIVVDDLASASPSTWTSGIVAIGDSGIFSGNVTLTPSAAGLVVRAEDYARPIFAGDLTIVASAGGSLTLRGLGVAGKVAIVAPPGGGSSSSASSSSSAAAAVEDPSFTLIVEHCLFRGRLTWTFAGGGRLSIDHSLCAALNVDPAVEIALSNSVVDGGESRPPGGGSSSSLSAGEGDTFVALAGVDGTGDCGSIQISASTVFGEIEAREVTLVENSIITGSVDCERTQAGCVRYSYVLPPPDSRVPPRFRCQPDLAIDAAVAAARRDDPALSSIQADAIRASVTAWLVPSFTSRNRNAAGYAQLADTCPVEIRTGAENGDEMGVFLQLYTPRREANLRFRLDEFLRIGLEAGIIHAS